MTQGSNLSLLHWQAISYFFFFNLSLLGCAGSLLLCGLFLSCSKWGLLFIAVLGFLIALASLVVEHGV